MKQSTDDISPIHITQNNPYLLTTMNNELNMIGMDGHDSLLQAGSGQTFVDGILQSQNFTDLIQQQRVSIDTQNETDYRPFDPPNQTFFAGQSMLNTSTSAADHMLNVQKTATSQATSGRPGQSNNKLPVFKNLGDKYDLYGMKIQSYHYMPTSSSEPSQGGETEEKPNKNNSSAQEMLKMDIAADKRK